MSRRGFIRSALQQGGGVLVLLVLASCGPDSELSDLAAPEPAPIICAEPFQAKEASHQVVGFYPAWKQAAVPPSEIRWDKLTRVLYAFARPREGGNLDVTDLTRVDELVANAHSQGVEVFLSIGGGAGSDAFPVMAAEAAARRAFIVLVRDYLGTHCLDGVDIDWEQWTKDADDQPLLAETAALAALLQELRFELEPLGLMLSIDVFASHWNGQHYDNVVPDLVDAVHVMAYDFSGPWSPPGPHSSFEQAIGVGIDASATGLAYWTGFRGWPKDKILLGLPFYGRDFDNEGGAGIAYRDIVALNPAAPTKDRVANIYYNGPSTIAAKTQFVLENGYPGVMIWEITHDTRDPATSLLHAVDQQVK